MNGPEQHIDCTWVQDRIEVYMDQALSSDEVDKCRVHIETCPNCAQELDLAEQIHVSLRALPLPEVPEHIADTVFTRIENELHAEPTQRQHAWWDAWRIPRWRPVIATAAAAILIVMGIYLYPQSDSPSTVSAVELERAKQEAKWALAYIGDVSHRTGLTVRDEVIGKRVVAPLHRSIGLK